MSNWQNGVTALNENNMRALYDLRVGDTNIQANTDLNNLTTVGSYKCTSSSVLATLLNLPDGVSSTFKLIVENISSSANYRQTIHVNGNYAISFVRTYGGSSWGMWKQTTGISSLSGTATTNADGYFGSGVNKANDIVSVTVMPTSGGAVLSGQVYTKSDITNQRVYVYNPDGTLAINTEVSYRIKYIIN